ncbi:hypothetical protein DPMN_178338 [Dreissena polymorpha]|uniref:Uncharacterized protein n=1 Tax=Dreissena polymorpha TaxID=45954 RepID=A0A9D4EAE6_DREPO|nr:hypothetical protein DPMN_178338 [Dreissena polymorpha]
MQATNQAMQATNQAMQATNQAMQATKSGNQSGNENVYLNEKHKDYVYHILI